jgi:hypothetical protein
MRRRDFLARLADVVTEQPAEATPYLTPGRIHRLLASEVADAVTVRLPGQSAPVIDFKRYDGTPEIFSSLRLGARESAAGVYVRGPVAFSVRVVTGSEPMTGVVFGERARVSVFRERDRAWAPSSGQIIIVAGKP